MICSLHAKYLRGRIRARMACVFPARQIMCRFVFVLHISSSLSLHHFISRAWERKFRCKIKSRMVGYFSLADAGSHARQRRDEIWTRFLGTCTRLASLMVACSIAQQCLCWRNTRVTQTCKVVDGCVAIGRYVDHVEAEEVRFFNVLSQDNAEERGYWLRSSSL